MRDMYFMEKIAVWLFIKRTTRHLYKLRDLEANELNLYQLELLHRAYSRVFGSIVDVYKWGKDLKPNFKWNSLAYFVKYKLVKIEEKANAISTTR